MRALLLVLVGCAAPKSVIGCPKGTTLGEDNRCYAISDTDVVGVGGADGGDDAGADDGDEPALPDFIAEPITPVYDAAGVVAALDDALVNGLPTPREMIDPYLSVMAQGDAVCPGHPDDLDGRWLLGCYASTGAFFSGVAFWESDDRSGRREGMSGDFRLIDPEGFTLEVGGAGGFDIGSAADKPAGAAAHGSVLWQRDDRWAAEGLSWAWACEIDRVERSMQLLGSFGFKRHYLSFDGAYLSVDCAGASGIVELRDPAGPWHTLDFGDSCSPCAVHSFPDQPDGEVCFDFSPVVEPFLARLEAE